MDKTGIAEMLRKLTEADGPSGSEDAVAAVVRSLVEEYAPEVRVDALGSVIARRRGAAEPPGRIMLAAHMDEIGLIVTKVEAGFLHVAAIGGVDPRSVLCQEVTVYPTGPGSEATRAGCPVTSAAGRRTCCRPASASRLSPWAICAWTWVSRRASSPAGSCGWATGSRSAGPTPSCSAAGWRPKRWTTGRAWRRCSARWATWRGCATPGTSTRWRPCRRRSACAARSPARSGWRPIWPSRST